MIRAFVLCAALMVGLGCSASTERTPPTPTEYPTQERLTDCDHLEELFHKVTTTAHKLRGEPYRTPYGRVLARIEYQLLALDCPGSAFW